MSDHAFATSLRWSGSTAIGYDDYSREHELTMASHTMPTSSDTAFGGDPAHPNPEQLLVAAASSCQMLSFLAVAARARIYVVDYRDEAVGEMPEGNRPMWVTRIALRPRITVSGTPAPGQGRAPRRGRPPRVLHRAEPAQRDRPRADPRRCAGIDWGHPLAPMRRQ